MQSTTERADTERSTQNTSIAPDLARNDFEYAVGLLIVILVIVDVLTLLLKYIVN
jgi:hypothetical protein